MSEGLNRAQILGNLGAHPELRYTAQGRAVMQLRIATTTGWTDRESGQREEHTEWHNVVVWGKQAEALAKFIRKGDQIFAEGELRTDKYEKDGATRYVTKIQAQRLVLCGRPRDAQSQPDNDGSAPRGTPPPRGAAPPRGAPPSPARGQPLGDEGGPPDDDIPF